MLRHGTEQLKKFTKLFESLARIHSPHQVFDDFLEYSILMMNIYKKPDDFKELEKRWTNQKEYALFYEMMMLYADIADDGGSGFYDGLGDLFMEYLSNSKNGQFFTPLEICDMQAQLIIGDSAPDGYTVYDPTCGSGRLLLSAAKINRRMRFYGGDVSLTCCKMTVLNMLMNTMCGEVAWMNSLSMEHWKSWHIEKVLYTNGVYLPVYQITGPGESQMIPRIKETMKAMNEEHPKPKDKSKPEQLNLF